MSEINYIYGHDSFWNYFYLESNSEKVLKSSLLNCFVRAHDSLLIMDCLETSGYFHKELDSNEKSWFAGLIYKQFLIFETNSISIYETVFKEDDSAISVKHCNTGYGIYNTLSLLNHSCSPNAFFVYFKDDTIALRTIRRVKTNEPLTVDYGTAFQGQLILFLLDKLYIIYL